MTKLKTLWTKLSQSPYRTLFLAPIFLGMVGLPFIPGIASRPVLAFFLLLGQFMGLAGLIYIGVWFVLLRTDQHYDQVQRQRVLRYHFLGAIVILGLVVGLPGAWMHPVSNDQGIKEDVVYVTYTPDCAYCHASEWAVRQGMALYSLTHPTYLGYRPIQLVELSEGQLADEFRQQARISGGVFMKDSQGLLIQQYTRADDKGEPKSIELDEFYELLDKAQQSRHD